MTESMRERIQHLYSRETEARTQYCFLLKVVMPKVVSLEEKRGDLEGT